MDAALVVGETTDRIDDGDAVIDVQMDMGETLSFGSTAYVLCFEASVVQDEFDNANPAGFVEVGSGTATFPIT